MRYIALICLLVTSAFGQVQFEPKMIFIDSESRIGTMTLKNPQDKSQEVYIQFKFGYFTYDSAGNPTVRYDDSAAGAKKSLKPYITAYPKKLVLPPNSEQLVRFLTRGFSELEDGLYWTRVVAYSQARQEVASAEELEEEITATASITFNIVNIIFFRKGKAFTDLEITDLTFSEDEKDYVFRFDAKVWGNSPFLGSSEVSIYDDGGDLVIEKKLERTAIYFTSPFYIKFRKKNLNLAPGKYTMFLALSNKRKDISKAYRIAFEEIEKNFEFTVPERENP